MRGDQRVRHCCKCDRNVYNLSEMTRDEANELIRQCEGKLCARIYLRSDGLAMTKDCGWRVKAEWKLRYAVAGVFALVGLGSLFAFPVYAGAAGPSPEWTLKYMQRKLKEVDEEIKNEKDPKELQDLKDFRDYCLSKEQEAAKRVASEARDH